MLAQDQHVTPAARYALGDQLLLQRVHLRIGTQPKTAHFEHVAGQAAAGIARVALETSVPIGFGVLTTEDAEQAEARAGGKAGNKGAEAALAIVETLRVLDAIGSKG